MNLIHHNPSLTELEIAYTRGFESAKKCLHKSSNPYGICKMSEFSQWNKGYMAYVKGVFKCQQSKM